MANPYQSTNPKSPITPNDKANAKELLVIMAVIIAAAIAYGYYHKVHEIANQPANVGNADSTTPNSNVNNP